ncbi:MAG: transcriptional repressor [Oscillospiraceae bacterium]|nr:transcriptional repressor [Oscillospiraceae bacterium]
MKERNTLQRKIVSDAIEYCPPHFSIEDLYSIIKEEYPSISKTTVYRNLRQLAKNSQIRQVVLHDGLERYERNSPFHYHFKCVTCDGIFDIDTGVLSQVEFGKISKLVEESYALTVEQHYVMFKGNCNSCE